MNCAPTRAFSPIEAVGEPLDFGIWCNQAVERGVEALDGTDGGVVVAVEGGRLRGGLTAVGERWESGVLVFATVTLGSFAGEEKNGKAEGNVGGVIHER